MLSGELVIRTDYRPVEEAPNAFHGVRMNVAMDPLVVRVGNPPMLRVPITQVGIGNAIVGVNLAHFFIHGVDDEVDDVFLGGATAGADAKPTAALDSTNDHCLSILGVGPGAAPA